MRTLTCPPGTETFGHNLRAFTDNLQSAATLPVMQKYGIVDVDPEAWQSVEALLSALNEMAGSPDVTSSLVAMGIEIGMITPVPDGLGLGDVLMGWNDAYQSLHRNGDVGTIAAYQHSDQHFEVHLTDLYPDDFSYGIMFGYARRFLPPGTLFTVYYDEDIAPRDHGGQAGYTSIHLTWED